jgi:hypothetical protein
LRSRKTALIVVEALAERIKLIPLHCRLPSD